MKHAIILALTFVFLFFTNNVYAEQDWRDTFPYLYIYDELLYEYQEKIAQEIFDENIESGLWSIYINEMPNYQVSRYNSDYLKDDLPTIQVVYDAITLWENANSDLKFEIVDNPNDASIEIMWTTEIDYENPVMGLTSSEITTLEDKDGNIQEFWYSVIQIDYVDYDCHGEPIYWNYETITDTVTHEIAHALGIQDHISDPTHIMYDEFDGIDVIEDYGYAFPTLKTQPQYLGEKLLNQEFDSLEAQIELLNERFPNSNDQYVDRYNSLVDKQNIIIDKLNCNLGWGLKNESPY